MKKQDEVLNDGRKWKLNPETLEIIASIDYSKSIEEAKNIVKKLNKNLLISLNKINEYV